MTSMQEFKAVYNGRILVPGQGEADSLQQDGYGYRKQKGQAELDYCEALYLLEKERLVIIDEGERRLLSFQEVLNKGLVCDPLLWAKYIIYRDIRVRGFVIKSNNDKSFLVYERGTYLKKPPSYEIYNIYEGATESIGHLEKMLLIMKESNRSLKLAVIDRRGEVVYYSFEKLSLGKLGTDIIE
jgi:tRNA-intron endonuclease, archaea type